MRDVGYAGPDVRSDVLLSTSPASEFGFEFTSSVSALYGDSIREQILSAAKEWGNPKVHLAAKDSGALPFVWRARLNAAFALQGVTASHSVQKTILVSPKKNRPRRSRLYVPGDTPKLLINATLSFPDVLIFDLEDSVRPDRKADALLLVAEALCALDYGSSEIAVRVNQDWEHEVRMLANLGVEAFWLPKVESPETIQKIDKLLIELNSKAVLVPLIESAIGVERAYEILSASPRIAAASLGIEDYLSDVGAKRTEGQAETAWARGRILNAAVATGVQPLASVYPGFEDLTKVTEYARTARESGYRGVGCIHPAQIPAVHLGFRPTPEELGRARQIVDAFEANDKSAVAVSGRMVDEPVYQSALQVLAMGDEE